MDSGKQIKIREDTEIAESVEIVSEILAQRLFDGSDFPKLAREACKMIGIYLDKDEYWWLWNEPKKRWEECTMIDIYNSIDDRIQDSTNTIEPKIKSLLKEALERQAKKNRVEMLDWKWIQFQDKLINFETGQEMKATNKYFISNPIPWKVGLTTETPVLDKLLNEWLNKDQDYERPINYLKDLFAFCLPTKYFIKTVPFLYGDGNDGKSQFIKVLSKFLGEGNYSSTTLKYLEKSQFGTHQLLKKLVCYLNEIPKNQIDQFTNVKTISGGDEVFIEAKGKGRKNETLYSKIIMVGNDVPITKDESVGFWQRIMPIKFPAYFEEAGEIFETIPDQEYENLALWCTQRLKVLAKEYKLSGKKNLKDTKKEYKLEANQLIKFFFAKNYVITHKQEDKIMACELNAKYNKWADSLGKPIMDGVEFKAKVQNLGLTVEANHTYVGGKETRRNFVFGLRLAKQSEIEEMQQKKIDPSDTADMVNELPLCVNSQLKNHVEHVDMSETHFFDDVVVQTIGL